MTVRHRKIRDREYLQRCLTPTLEHFCAHCPHARKLFIVHGTEEVGSNTSQPLAI